MRLKKFFIILTSIIGVLVAFVLINFLPTLSLANSKMSVFVGDWVNVYYETEGEAARDTFELADARAAELAELLGVSKTENIDIYIYDSQKAMQRKKYGFIAHFLGLEWYIGDNIGTDIILTSPANPGSMHDYNNVKNAVLHEMVHSYNHLLNEDMSYWVDNGLAGYLSEQEPKIEYINGVTIPTIKQTQIKGLLSPIKFSDFGGYQYSYIYIEYLHNTYSWDSIKTFAKTGDYIEAFGVGEQKIYDGWVEYIRKNWL